MEIKFLAMEFGKEIVFNRMYNGDYLNDNLGHEIINLYKSDNGNNYIYLNHLGNFSAEHIGRVGAVLLVRTVPGKKMLEVLGLADGITDVYRPFQAANADLKYIAENNITYGGVLLDQIFVSNEKKQTTYITYKAEKVYKPVKTCYIKFAENNDESADENCICLYQNKQAKASLKQYISEETPQDYRVLFDFISNSSNWGSEVDVVSDQTVKEESLNFFKICGIENSELAFSNALAYFMKKYPHLLSLFAKEIIGKEFVPTDKFEIIRESEANIDLLLKDRENLIVVENKIKSHINGLIFNRYSKELESTQLKKYYDHAHKIANGRRLSFYVLLPDYNDIDLLQYECGNCYTKIYYSQLYDFLVRQNVQDPYLKDFICALEKHTRKYDNELYEDMMRKFYLSINKRKENK